MIRLEHLSVEAGEFRLTDVSVEIDAGRWAILLGPAGAGKTTLLETIAGVRMATGGRILLRGVDLTVAPAESRGAAIVYQQGFLFPHLSVSDNITYGARDAAYAAHIATRFGADALRARPVHALSGGERQLVALVRALAPRPDIVLLDEPFSALDPRTRSRVRRELQALHREERLTVLQVTHDFAEAGTVGDLALLMERGQLVQAAPPEQLFRHPATAAAAEFLGAENIYAGSVSRPHAGPAGVIDTLAFDAGALRLVAVGTRGDGPAHAVVRAEDVALSRDDDGASRASARNVLTGTVVELVPSGVITRVIIDVQGEPLISVITSAAARELALHPGMTVVASIKATAVHLC